jgi:hypothetical protein
MQWVCVGLTGYLVGCVHDDHRQPQAALLRGQAHQPRNVAQQRRLANTCSGQ